MVRGLTSKATMQDLLYDTDTVIVIPPMKALGRLDPSPI